MSKDITEEILLKAGFKYFEGDSDNTSYYSYSPDENEKGNWSIILTYSKKVIQTLESLASKLWT